MYGIFPSKSRLLAFPIMKIFTNLQYLTWHIRLTFHSFNLLQLSIKNFGKCSFIVILQRRIYSYLSIQRVILYTVIIENGMMLNFNSKCCSQVLQYEIVCILKEDVFPHQPVSNASNKETPENWTFSNGGTTFNGTSFLCTQIDNAACREIK